LGISYGDKSKKTQVSIEIQTAAFLNKLLTIWQMLFAY